MRDTVSKILSGIAKEKGFEKEELYHQIRTEKEFPF